MNSLEFEDLDKYLIAQKGRIIHQVWFGTIPNNREAKKTYVKLKKYRDSWKIKNPRWCHMEWNKNLSNKFVQYFFPEHYEMYKNYPYEIQRCDSIRYMILYRYGGLYADMDYYCNKPFDEVFDKYNASFYLVQTPNGISKCVSNSLMFSVPRHPFWKCFLIEMEISKDVPMYYSKHLTVMFTAGPGILNRSFNKFKHRFKLKSWPYRYFQPYTHIEDIFSLKNNNVYAIHASNGCWHGTDTMFGILFIKEWKFLLFVISITIVSVIVYKIIH